MRFRVLGSGSRGNATIIDSGSTRLLVDNGFALKEIKSRAESIGFELDQLDAVLITHEHSDHIKGVGALARHYNLPVHATHGTLRTGKCGRLETVHTFLPHETAFRIGDIEVQPVPVPHDANEPCQFVFTANSTRLGVLTDLGHITPVITRHFEQLDLLLLECNHDMDMLEQGPYPRSLQRRVGGNQGHLNNHQAMSLLNNIQTEQLKQLVLGHLSEQNNHPEKVSESIYQHCEPVADRFSILKQDSCSEWFGVV